ncbi:MAG TPA: hypothetical protein VKU91_10070, partial [Acidimicrobiales bacterium]|nr:hypothetical protein [Acidimicrobiales bacterium]
MSWRRGVGVAVCGLLAVAMPAAPAFAQTAPTLSPPTATPLSTVAGGGGGGTSKTEGSVPLPSVSLPSTLPSVPFPLPTTSTTTVPPAVPPHCYPESYPAAGAPANGPSQPYEIPVTAVIDGGEFSVTGTKGGVLQLGPDYTIHASLCGLVTLPSQAGVIAPNGPPPASPGNEYYNNNLVFSNPIPVAVLLPGVPLVLLEGYGASMGVTNAQIELTPAANGGLNVDLYGSAKSTANFDQNALTGLLPPGPGECTVAIGDLEQDGLTAAQVAALG